MAMNPDFEDILRELIDAKATFMVVGAYAVGIHGHPRATKDFDIWVEATDENAPRVLAALQAFGAPLMGLTEGDLRQAGSGLQIGVPPGRIDIITQISGVDFGAAKSRTLQAQFGSLACPVIGLDDLLDNKRASARPQDLADVSALERLRAARSREPK